MVVVTVVMLSAILSILVGVLVLLWPKVLNYAIAVYLILLGILQLLGIYVNIA